MNETENSEINSHVYGKMLFNKDSKSTQWENWKFICKQITLDPYLMSYMKINSKQVKAGPENVKLLEKDIEV